MDDIRDLSGVGDETLRLLHRIGLKSVEDIVENIPRKYDDYSVVTPIANVRPGTVTIKGTIHSVKSRYAKKGLHITEAIITDESGSIKANWFNQPFRAKSIKENHEYYVSGVFAKNYRYLQLQNPTCELVSDFPLHTARLVPQYKLTKGLRSSLLRKVTKQALEKSKDIETLPLWMVKEYSLIARNDALRHLHFPEKLTDLELAKKRIGFEELFEMTLASELNKADFSKEKALYVPFSEQDVVNFVKKLPFKLTDDQRKAAWEVLQDMTHGSPMNRLLEGDVGSGKTAVAAIAAVNALSQGFQVAFMAPTELLAQQHATTLRSLLPDDIANQVGFVSGRMNAKEKKETLPLIADGTLNLIIGTHALLEQSVAFNRLALVIIDEQHRFGVEQRKRLQAKSKVMPHVLHMTATPIPRSVALTLYGELDVSLLKHKPNGRIPVKTKLSIPEKRPEIYAQVVEELRDGRQAFVVCPQIEASEKTIERPLSVEQIATQIAQWVSPYKVGILHGKMHSKDKEKIMEQFITGDLKVLVSTTVIEVGVNIPNASVMVIEGADRFGLAQLHQLRGRVGRGKHHGICYLIPTTNDSPSQRLQIIEQQTDGFALADYDLELRGPGALYGTLQHGALDLRVAKLSDVALIQLARRAAKEFIKREENLVYYSKLNARVNRLRTITNLN